MFILTDGKNYVMENPMKQGTYISTTLPIQAKEFTWKQARALLQNKKKSMTWIRAYNAVDQDTNTIDKDLNIAKETEVCILRKMILILMNQLLKKYMKKQNQLLDWLDGA